MSRRQNNPLFALPAAPPEEITLAGARYRIALVFKHDFFAATCLYELVDTPDKPFDHPSDKPQTPTESVPWALGAKTPGAVQSFVETKTQSSQITAARMPKIVVKFGRVQDLLGLPMRWLGELNRDHEEAIYRTLAGIEGVPRWAGRVGEVGYAIEYIDGRPMDHDAPPPGFFDRLRGVMDQIHARGVAYGDGNKRSNVLITRDGQPFVIDYQVSLRRRDDLPWPLRGLIAAFVRYIQGKDLYHIYKHKRRLAGGELTPQEDELSRQRGGLHGLHRTLTKPYRAIRRAFLRKQYQQGRLVSPTAAMEEHYQPEKETWRGN